MATLRLSSWQKESDTILTAIGQTTMSTKLMEADENPKQAEKSASIKASWQQPKASAMTKPNDGKASLTQKTVLIVPSEEELKDLMARLQDLMRSWQSPRPLITNDYVIVAFPTKGNKISVMAGGHGNVFTVNNEPVTSVMADK
jgi:hypothetical protein